MYRKILTAVSATILSIAFTAPVFAQQVKWHPGHYVTLAGEDSMKLNKRNINEIGNVSSIKGVKVKVWWSDVETSKGKYDFSKIDQLLAALRSQPQKKYLVIKFMDRCFGANTCSKSRAVPSYMLNSAYGGGVTRSKSNGWVARQWDKRVMNRWIALFKAVGNRYNSEPLLEGVMPGESTLSLPKPFPSGYSNELLGQQYNRLVSQVKGNFKNTNFWMNLNYIGSTSIMNSVVSGSKNNTGGFTGPNTMPNTLTLGQKVLTGSAGPVYTWSMPVSTGVEGGELGGNLGNYTPAQIADFAYNTLTANHIFWVRNTWQGKASQRWSTGILPFLKTNPRYRKNCPQNYASCKWN